MPAVRTRERTRPPPGSRNDAQNRIARAPSGQNARPVSARSRASRSSPSGQFAGQHDFKTGVSVYWDRTSDVCNNNLAVQLRPDYRPRQRRVRYAVRIRVYNTPVAPLDNEDIYAWYFKDSWRSPSRLTFNLGLRWEWQHSYLPEQHFGGARDFPTVFPASSFTYIDVQTINRIVPRHGHRLRSRAANRSSRRPSASTTTFWVIPTPTCTTRTRPATRCSCGTTTTTTSCTSQAR